MILLKQLAVLAFKFIQRNLLENGVLSIKRAQRGAASVLVIVKCIIKVKQDGFQQR
jgi:hypothetical protein